MKIVAKLIVFVMLPLMARAEYELIVTDVSNQKIHILPFDKNGVVEHSPFTFIEFPSDYDKDGNPSEQKERIGLGLTYHFQQIQNEDDTVEFKYALKYSELVRWDYYPTGNHLVEFPNIESTSTTNSLHLNEEFTYSKRDSVRTTNLATGDTMDLPGNNVRILYSFKIVKK